MHAEEWDGHRRERCATSPGAQPQSQAHLSTPRVAQKLVNPGVGVMVREVVKGGG